MLKQLVPLDYNIIEVARKLFLTIGIRQTEMKDIAQEVEISRSTLYRHFASKEQIAFYIAKDILLELMTPEHSDSDLNGYNGYQKVEFCLLEIIQRLLSYPEKVRFLDEFDQIFTDNYPDTEEAKAYVEFNQRKDSFLHQYLQEGIEDTSIRPIHDIFLEVDVIINIILGLAQRIIPRANHYIEEHGLYQEFIHEAVRMIMYSIKGIKVKDK